MTMDKAKAPTRRHVCQTLILAPLAAAVAAPWSFRPAHAQAFPNRPVRIVVPFAAGGIADITVRIVGEKLGERFGQRFVIENQPGPGGIAAARNALTSAADGYTLAMLTNGTAITVPLFNSLPFDPLKDFVPISSLGFFDFILAANADSPFRTLADVLKAAREKPGTLNIGTINVGSTQNLSAELFKSATGISLAIIPYRTTPDAIVGLLRNDVQLVIDTYAAFKAQLAEKKIRALASSGPARSELLRDVPTVQESGVRDFDVTSWNALFAPAGTPAATVEILNRGLREVLAAPEVKKRLLDLGIEAKASSPAEIGGRLRADIEKWSRVIERAGIPKQ
jgi:tripartite-type tricarboxylate transporter receptor subunit TctC